MGTSSKQDVWDIIDVGFDLKFLFSDESSKVESPSESSFCKTGVDFSSSSLTGIIEELFDIFAHSSVFPCIHRALIKDSEFLTCLKTCLLEFFKENFMTFFRTVPPMRGFKSIIPKLSKSL